MAHMFQVNVSTNLNRLMRHVDHHFIHLGCFRRGSSEENETAYKDWKGFTTQAPRHNVTPVVKNMGSLDRSSGRHCRHWFGHASSAGCQTNSFHISHWFSSASSGSIAFVNTLSFINPQNVIVQRILLQELNVLRSLRCLIWIQICPHVRYFNTFLYISLFAGSILYGKRDRHDGVLFCNGNINNIWVLEAIFQYYQPIFPASDRFVLIRL